MEEKLEMASFVPRPTNPPEDGFPEALHFYIEHRCLTLTLETPSEV